MYSLTRFVIEPQLERITAGISTRGERDEQHRDAVDAHAVADGVADPGVVLDELEVGVGRVELVPEPEAQHRGDEGHARARSSARG